MGQGLEFACSTRKMHTQRAGKEGCRENVRTSIKNERWGHYCNLLFTRELHVRRAMIKRLVYFVTIYSMAVARNLRSAISK